MLLSYRFVSEKVWASRFLRGHPVYSKEFTLYICPRKVESGVPKS